LFFLFLAEWRSSPKRVTAEYGSDLSLSCTFQNGDSDETVRSFFEFSIKKISFRLFNGFIKI